MCLITGGADENRQAAEIRAERFKIGGGSDF